MSKKQIQFTLTLTIEDIVNSDGVAQVQVTVLDPHYDILLQNATAVDAETSIDCYPQHHFVGEMRELFLESARYAEEGLTQFP